MGYTKGSAAHQRYLARRREEYATDAAFREEMIAYQRKRRAGGRAAKRTPHALDKKTERVTGFSPGLFARCWEAQGGLCAIFGVALTYGAKDPCRVNRDHDHTTGEPRGLLSFAANAALGAYEKMLARGGRHVAEFDAYLADPPARKLK